MTFCLHEGIVDPYHVCLDHAFRPLPHQGWSSPFWGPLIAIWAHFLSFFTNGLVCIFKQILNDK